MVPGGCSSGIGKALFDTWRDPFESFAIGDEIIHNPSLEFGDIWSYSPFSEIGARLSKFAEGLPDMLLGFDFLRAHRVLIANSQRKVYFSYLDGPVFPAPPFSRACDDVRNTSLAEFDELVRLNPRDPTAYLDRGSVFHGRGEFERAIADFDAALGFDAQFTEAYAQRAYARMGKGDYDRAISDFDSALRLEPRELGRLRGRGVALFLQGRFEEADKTLTEVAKARPWDSYAAIWLHFARMRTGKDAKAELQEAADRIRRDEWLVQVLRLFLGEIGPERLAPSAPDSDSATRSGRQCEADYYAGQWHLMRGDVKSAEPLLLKAKQSCPKTYLAYDGAVAELNRLPPH